MWLLQYIDYVNCIAKHKLVAHWWCPAVRCMKDAVVVVHPVLASNGGDIVGTFKTCARLHLLMFCVVLWMCFTLRTSCSCEAIRGYRGKTSSPKRDKHSHAEPWIAEVEVALVQNQRTLKILTPNMLLSKRNRLLHNNMMCITKTCDTLATGPVTRGLPRDMASLYGPVRLS